MALLPHNRAGPTTKTIENLWEQHPFAFLRTYDNLLTRQNRSDPTQLAGLSVQPTC